ncbi:MAG: efflux RND transporter periplasmic adaptor subunit [Pseudomonadota bacterium]|nr:efflux RND transporter periplasmic adaptor subunit [Pseudomonadota bacterium]
MIKRMLIMLLAVAVVLGAVFGFQAFKGAMIAKYMAGMGNQPQVVSDTKAAYQDWQPQLSAVGTARAVNGADMSSEVSGIVQAINFESGADVEKGSVLVQLRADDDIAKLHALEATAKLAEVNYQRDIKQVKAQAISQAAVDSDAATLESAKAQMAEQQAVLDKKMIRAPFAGHLGIRQTDIGQYLNPGSPIVTLQQLDPIYIDFNLPEQSLPQLMVGSKVSATTDATSGQTFDGEVLAINSKIDEATRNVQVRASFRNPDRKLLPGMFATVSIQTGKPLRYITLPQTAITYNPYGNTVFIIDSTDSEKPVARQSFVTTGETRGDQIAILKGVNEGDMVVTSGQLKLRNGTPVKINNEIQPSNDPDPKPVDR